jgi:integrase/recombinase XerD
MSTKSPIGIFPTLVQDFFCQHLIQQRGLSPKTVASYRDTFRLLLRYLQTSTKKSPESLNFADLDAPSVLAFLDYLEKCRKNAVQSRNVRLAAIRSFMRYASFRDPASLQMIYRVLAIPMKRFDHPRFEFLSRDEMKAVLGAPDCSTWSGHRDCVMFATFYNTGARISEVIALRVKDVLSNDMKSVQIRGKGRKQRVVPLWKNTTRQLREWLRRVNPESDSPLFPNRNGTPMSRTGIENRLHLAITRAADQCPTLKNRRISPHSLRHTTAMHLLQSGVDITVIALWLGHASPTTTHLYVEADLAMKERTLKKLHEPTNRPLRFKSGDRLLSFLESL